MSRFWVLRLFNLQAVRVGWSAEAEKLGYDGHRRRLTTTLFPFSSAGCCIPRSACPESRSASGGEPIPAAISRPSS